MGILLDCGGASDVGPFRSNNEDSGFSSATCALVADGVGGGPAGELASSLLIHRLAPGTERLPSADAVRESIRVSNWDLTWHARRDPSVAGMASTLTGLFVTATGLVLAHVGDSRAYRMRGGVGEQVTRDDSYVQMLVDAGLIDEQTAASHPRRNIVTASLSGTPRDGEVVSVTEVEATLGDRWLMCSDGISDYLPCGLVFDTLTSGTPSEAATALVNLAVAAGTRDNATAVVCDVVMDAALSRHRARPNYYGAAAEHFVERDIEGAEFA